MGRYVADTDAIVALVERAESVGKRFEDRIADVEREVSALGLDWDGDGSEAHRSRHEVLQREMRDMRDALTSLGALAREARDRYCATAELNKRMWP